MPKIIGRKVIVSAREVSHFNARWPCSELRSTRSYALDFTDIADQLTTAAGSREVNVYRGDDGLIYFT